MRVQITKDTEKGTEVLILPRRGFGLVPVELFGENRKEVLAAAADVIAAVDAQERLKLFGVSPT